MGEGNSWQWDSQGKGLHTEVCLAHSGRGSEAGVAKSRVRSEQWKDGAHGVT